MSEISIGAVGAAITAGLVSILGLIIGKEQKISEFRHAWINDLRKCFVDYLVNINAICDLIRLHKASGIREKSSLLPFYKALNESSNGIKLRINDEEKTAKDLLSSMTEFEDLTKSNNLLTPERIMEVEGRFILASKNLLKYEWRRVKKGESTFVISKRLIFAVTAIMFFIFIYSFLIFPDNRNNSFSDHLHLVDAF